MQTRTLKKKTKKQPPLTKKQLNAYLKQRTAVITQIKLDTGEELAERLQLHRWDYIVAGDGSATRLETPAGFGAILYSRHTPGSRKKLFGGLSHGTNNMAEMMAVISALLYLEGRLSEGEKPTVYVLSDNSYVVKGGNEEIKPKTNLSLWASIEQMKHRMNLIFVHVNRMLLPANIFGDKTGNLIRTSFETFTKILNKHAKQTKSNNDRR